MARLDVFGILQRPFLDSCFRVSNQADALCSMILNSSDLWRVENYSRGSLMEFSLEWRIQVDLLCGLSPAVKFIQIHRKRLL
jgi:hypothetical protein